VILSPLPTNRAKMIPVGVMNDDGSMDKEKNATLLYASSPLPVLRLIRHYGGSGTAIRVAGHYRWTSFHMKETKIIPTGQLDLESVVHWRDYCYDRGISARSLQGMGFYLLRSTLAGNMDLDEGITMPINAFPASAHLYAREGVYRDVYQSDIRAAYLSALVSMSPASYYHRIRRISLKEVLTHGDGVFVRCSYRVGSKFDRERFGAIAQNGVIPRRWGVNRLLSVDDLRLVALLGWDVRILEAWIPSKVYPTPFSAFGMEVASIRNDPIMGKVAKLASNTVWGSFSAGSRVAYVTFPGGGSQPKTVFLPPRNKLCPPLAFSIIARLRYRVMVEGMGESTVQAHTDGIISSYPLETGDEIGDWRLVGKYDRVDVVRPGCYAVTINGETTYKVAGRTGSDQVTRQMFRERLMRNAYRLG